MSSLLLLADSSGPSDAVAGLIGLPFVIAMIAGYWKMFEKAGEPGWAVLVPIYNIIVMCRIAGTSLWWILGLFIPIVNIVAIIVLYLFTPMRLCRAFGQGAVMGCGMIFLPFIIAPILGFGDYEFEGTPE